MEQRLQLADIAAGLVRRNNMPVKEAELFVRQFFDCIGENLFHDNIVKVKGLGTFKLVTVETRESVDINSGQRITIEEHTKVSFTPDPVLRDAVNKPFAEFETVVLNENTPLEAMEAMEIKEECPIEETPEEKVSAEEDNTEDTSTKEDPTEELSTEEDSTEEPSTEEEPTEEDSTQEDEAPAEEELPPSETPATDESPTEESRAAVIAQRIAPETMPEREAAVPETKHRRCFGYCCAALSMIVCLLMFVIGYVVGYHRPLSLPECSWLSAPETEQTAPSSSREVGTQVTTKKQPVAVPVPSASADSSDVHPQKKPSRQPSETLAYPQVEGGEYYIVGIKGTEVMSKGKTLLNISIKYYKSKEFVEYICKMNNITNPDIVPLGKELKIPELKQK